MNIYSLRTVICGLWTSMESKVLGPKCTYSIRVDFGVVRPIIFTKNDEIIFEDGEFDLNVYHFDSGTITYIVEEQGCLKLLIESYDSKCATSTLKLCIMDVITIMCNCGSPNKYRCVTNQNKIYICTWLLKVQFYVSYIDTYQLWFVLV